LRPPCPSTPAAPLLALTFRYAFQINVFGISNGFLTDFVSSTQLLPYLVDCRTTPDGTSPSLQAHYRPFITTTRRSALLTRTRYSAACGLATCRSPGRFLLQSTETRIMSRSSPVPLQSPSQARAIFMPDTAKAVNRYPSGLSQNSVKAPVLMSPSVTPRHRWFTFVRLLGSYLRLSRRLFHGRSPPWLIHHSSSWRFDTSTCIPMPKDLPSSLQQHGHCRSLCLLHQNLSSSLQDTPTLSRNHS
jgi:hypothetical protein